MYLNILLEYLDEPQKSKILNSTDNIMMEGMDA